MVSLRDFILGISPLSESAWQDINALFLPKQLRKGDYFITEGKTATQIGFISSGIVRAFAKGKTDRSTINTYLPHHHLLVAMHL